jgi:hypothetical protein
MMRVVRVVLALVFGLAVAGPETHACPVHSAPPPNASHHQDAGNGHHETALCTCPQACCPSGVSLSVPVSPSGWSSLAAPVLAVDLSAASSSFLPSRTHLLPFALGPPRALA